MLLGLVLIYLKSCEAHAAWTWPPSDDALVTVNGCSGVRVQGNPRYIYILTAAHCVRGAIGIQVQNPKTNKIVGGAPAYWKNDVVVVELLSQPGVETFLKLNTAALSVAQPEPGEMLWMLTTSNDVSGRGPANVTLYSPAISIGKDVQYNNRVFKQVWVGGMYRGFSGSPFYYRGVVVGVLSVAFFRSPDTATYWGGYSPIPQEIIDWLGQKAREQ